MRFSICVPATSVTLLLVLWTNGAFGAFTVYDDRDEWELATGEFTTIGFADYPHGTWIFEQYAHLGVHFVDGADIVLYSPGTYPRDDYGLDGNEEIHLTFDMLITSIAVDFPGSLAIDIYRDGEFLETTDFWGGGGVGFFGGFVFDTTFDEAIIYDYDGQVNLDDLHFGPPIPAPSALGLLAAAGLLVPRRRRR
jgi:hypothetical protein